MPPEATNRLVPASDRTSFPVVLSEALWFPDPRRAPVSGRTKDLIAIGGDLEPERLLLAYRSGLFPWTVNPVTWWSPDPRAIIELDAFAPPRSLAKLLRKRPFHFTVNQSFDRVMRECARPAPGREGTWITPEFIRAYSELHRLGHAHSVECWQDGTLAGGIYGVATGGLFAGESMFHRVPNASKAALTHLVERLRDRDFALFDIQMATPVTLQLGAKQIARAEYLDRLREAVRREVRFAG